jgi:putative ABC transport system permease protein
MNITVLLSTSIRTLKNHKVRSLLTILGIMIGIAAIIITFSIGRGAEEAVASQILTMGEDAVYIIPSSFVKHGGLRGGAKTTRMRERDIEIIQKLSPEVTHISPVHMSIQTLEYGGNKIQINLSGVQPCMINIDANIVKRGFYFDDTHVKRRSNVIVIGSKPAEKLFGATDPIGKYVLVNGHALQIIGVLDKKPHYFGPRDPNEQAYLPYTTSKKICRQPDEASDELTAIAIRLQNGTDSTVFRRKIGNIMRFINNTQKTEEDPFVIFDTQTLTQVARDMAGIIRLFGLLAASISLIVGSIGVMNIMLVSVKERTGEIGLRLAIGATQRLIQLQFLIESVTLCFIGGVIGIIIGILGQLAISHGTSLTAVMEAGPMIVSLIVTVLIGIFFGYYPAYQASQLNPVDALMHR